MLGVFESVDDATTAISEIIGAGIVPAALEMMDQGILVAVEAAFQFGFPLDAQAILLIEVDGLEAGLDQQRDQIIELCKKCGAREVRLARDEKERLKLWKCRKQAFGAIGRLSPSYCTQDGVVPRTKLPHILRKIIEIGQQVRHSDRQRVSRRRRQHPSDPAVRRAQRRAGAAGAGRQQRDSGRVPGLRRQRHGRARHRRREDRLHEQDVHADSDLAAMKNLRDAFNPHGNLSPDKMLPTAGGCGMEQKHPGRRAAL